jgi:hypothetical protein
MMLVTTGQIEQIFQKWNLPLKFDADEQRQLSNTTHIVDAVDRILGFPTPKANDGLNILNLRRLLGVDPRHPPSFFDHPWYLDEDFARKNCFPGWHFLHMDVTPGSLSKSHNYHYSYKSENSVLPSAIEIVLMLFIHFEMTGERLLFNKHTWCSDMASLERFVTVGAFGRNGLFISSHPPLFASRGLGLCERLVSS